MHHLIKSFFYSVALLTLFWISKTSPDDITFAAWVGVVQNPVAQQAAAILTLIQEVMSFVTAGIFSTPSCVSRAGYVVQQRVNLTK